MIEPVVIPAELAEQRAEVERLISQANEHHALCIQSLSYALQHALDAGTALVTAKAACPHGEWLPMLERSFDGSQPTASRYMTIARELPALMDENYSSMNSLSVSDALNIIKRLKQERRALERGEPITPPAPVDPDTFVFEPQTTNIWSFPTCDPRFGADHPGRIPGQIVANVLHLYTDPVDVVLDPFAGSGTTLDVCHAMGRQCLAYDIDPRRPDIQQRAEHGQGWPDLSGVKLAFLDPPYWRQKRGEYTDQADDLSNLDLDDFYVSIEELARGLRHVLTDDGHVALIISQARVDGVVNDLAFDSTRKFRDAGYRLVERIIVPYANATSDTGYWHAQAREGRWLMRAFRDLMVFEP